MSAGRTTTILMILLALLLLMIACGDDYQPEEVKEHFFGPTRLAVHPDVLQDEGPLLYAVNTWGGSMTIIRVVGYDIIKDHSLDPYNPDVIWLGKAPHDIVITPDGGTLYVTDALRDAVRLVDPEDPWTVSELDLEFDGARLDVVPPVIDRDTLEFTTPEVWRERPEIWFMDGANDRLVVWDHAAMEVAGEVALPSTPVEIEVSVDGQSVFVTSVDGMLRVVDAAAQALTDIEVFLGGKPGAIAENSDNDDLYVLNIDPPQLHIIDRRDWQQTDEEIYFHAALNDMALSTSGAYGFVTSDDGFLYYFFPRQRRVCGSSYEPPRFFDKGPNSNPELTDIQTKDCLTSEEEWRISYLQSIDAWEVEGTSSGLQFTYAATGQAYASDRDEIRFVIRAGDRAPSDGDTFRLFTDSGEPPVPIGTVPRGVIVSPVADDEEFFGEDRVFVADPGTNSVTRLITFETDNRNIID
ncbi:MAG: hypothetical protein P9L99_11570 [Candidatus Lernaella stagnicola]|nr:hypothetical protein [Candidatus Lernaella stagnicola]